MTRFLPTHTLKDYNQQMTFEKSLSSHHTFARAWQQEKIIKNQPIFNLNLMPFVVLRPFRFHSSFSFRELQ